LGDLGFADGKGDRMDNVTIIRAISGVLFVVVLFVLIQRRKSKVS
jgi:hypothetical protein